MFANGSGMWNLSTIPYSLVKLGGMQIGSRFSNCTGGDEGSFVETRHIL